MKSTKNTLILITSLCLIFSLILMGTACKATETVTETIVETVTETVTETVEVEKETKDVKLTFWFHSSTPEALHTAIDDFTEEYGLKSVEIQYLPTDYDTSVLTKWNAGERPDILWSNPGPKTLRKYRPEENLIDLSDMEFVQKDKFGLLKYTSEVDGKIYGPNFDFPWMVGAMYSKKIFDELNLEIPGSFEELLVVCEKIKEAGYTPIYTGGGSMWPMQLFPFAYWSDAVIDGFIDKLNTNQADFTDEVIVEGIRALKELHDKGYLNDDIMTATFEDETQVLNEGNVAMVFNTHRVAVVMAEQFGNEVVDEKVGFFGFSKNSNLVSIFPTCPILVPKTGDPAREEASIEFIKYITGDRYQQYVNEIGTYPIYEGFESPEGLLKIYDDITYWSENSGTASILFQYSYGSFHVWLNEMIGGLKTPEEVAEAMDAAFTQTAIDAGDSAFE